MLSMAGPLTAAAVAPQVEDVVISSPLASAPECDPSLHLPRILCLHGGGTNGRIFRTQCRIIRAHLAPFFRFVFADAPFFSKPGPDVEQVYADWGPFRSWLRVRPGSGPGSEFALLDADEVVVESIDQCIAAAKREDDNAGATGTWVGLLGFSQGARMAASLLLRQQNQDWKKEATADRGRHGQTWETDYRFAVLLAGRAPLVFIDLDMKIPSATRFPDPGLLRLPTIHVHGLRDAGISTHRELLHKCCEKGTTRLVEWDGDHRVPIKTKDVASVAAAILDVANETSVFVR